MVGLVRRLWQAEGEAPRQAVRPSGDRGVCGAERVKDTLTNTLSILLVDTETHVLLVDCIVIYLLETHALNL